MLTVYIFILLLIAPSQDDGKLGGGVNIFNSYKMKGNSIHQFKTFSICGKIRHRRYMNNFILLLNDVDRSTHKYIVFTRIKKCVADRYFVSEQLRNTIKNMQGVRVSHIDQESLQIFHHLGLEIAGCQWPKAG